MEIMIGGCMMLVTIPGLPDNVVGFTAKEKVTGSDYKNILIPMIEGKLKKYDKVSILYQMGEDFEGFEIGAAWEDTMVGLKHLSSWDRIAVVTDIPWIRGSMSMFGMAMPGHVRVFKNDDFDAAVKWISG